MQHLAQHKARELCWHQPINIGAERNTEDGFVGDKIKRDTSIALFNNICLADSCKLCSLQTSDMGHLQPTAFKETVLAYHSFQPVHRYRQGHLPFQKVGDVVLQLLQPLVARFDACNQRCFTIVKQTNPFPFQPG
jgi:hypothetical protein